jgi:m7GpppX diphosphatase
MLTKSMVLRGKIDGHDAIAIMSKMPFVLKSWKKPTLSLAEATGLQQSKYTQKSKTLTRYLATLVQDCAMRAGASIKIIYPTTDKEIQSYRKERMRLVRESPEDYTNLVLPYIQSLGADHGKWMRDILYNGGEADRIIHRNNDPLNGYVLLPDE